MTQNISLPTRYATSQWIRPSIFPGRILPFLPSLGFPAIICGALGIASVVAPQWVETIIPHFRERYLPVVSIVVALALLSFVWRLIKATVGMFFFGVAALALLYSFNGGSISHFSIPDFLKPSHYSVSSPSAQRPPFLPHSAYYPTSSILPKSKLPPALPDEAYFPRPKSQEESYGLGRVGATDQIAQQIRNLLR